MTTNTTGTADRIIMDDIYNSKILEFAGNIPAIGGMDDADASAEAFSKLCGSKVKVYIKMRGDEVTEFSHQVKACALGQASSSIMARHVVGATADEIETARDDMRAMLTAGGDGPSGRFEDMRYLLPVRDYKSRHASTMLTFDAVVDAIHRIRAKAPADAEG
jgi:NifU-like protein involved in Fe-S cluster formation